MRLWTLHPRYLDTRGLVAVWREALLAQAVLRGLTRGYTHHPQLSRFQASPSPVATIADYLREIHREGARRGYKLDAAKIARRGSAARLPATRGQMSYEWFHLMSKLEERDPERFIALGSIRRPRAHPLFHVIGGDVESWERVSNRSRRPRVGNLRALDGGRPPAMRLGYPSQARGDSHPHSEVRHMRAGARKNPGVPQ